MATLKRRLTILQSGYVATKWREAVEAAPEFFRYAFHDETLSQLLYLRSELKWKSSRCDGMVAALVLGSLHGEMDKSSSYFSNQMPRTISTKPAYSVRFWQERELVAPQRDVFGLLRARAIYRYETPPPTGDAVILHRDMRQLTRLTETLPGPINCAIMSPPYLDVTNFEEDQWLRLWFLGGPTHPTRGRLSRDDRHESSDAYWRFIADMWRSMGQVMGHRANVVVRLGSRITSPEKLQHLLVASSRFSGRDVKLVHQEISELKNRQTDAFRPGTKGCLVEIDCHFQFDIGNMVRHTPTSETLV
ncbi:hypothetical protein [Paludisphaera soli]|uniref:hypothetical protein n=1 Tax=Paludisphaera soli TaxID=2712865 RepID=UPI001F0E0AEE|nr:hypothetical protein [Paludisphaera soli]